MGRVSLCYSTVVDDVTISDFKIISGIRMDAPGAEEQLRLTVKFRVGGGEFNANTETDFEIFSGEEVKVSGKMRSAKATEAVGPSAVPGGAGATRAEDHVPYVSSITSSPTLATLPPDSPSFGHSLGHIAKGEFYNRIGRNGYNYLDKFQLVDKVGIDSRWAWVKFDNTEKILQDQTEEFFEKTGSSALFPQQNSFLPRATKNVAEMGSLAGLTTEQEKALAEEEAKLLQPREQAITAIVRNRYWISYLDNLLQVSLLGTLADSETLRVPMGIREVVIRGSKLLHFLKTSRDGSVVMKEIGSTMTRISSDNSIASEAIPGNMLRDPSIASLTGNSMMLRPASGVSLHESTTAGGGGGNDSAASLTSAGWEKCELDAGDLGGVDREEQVRRRVLVEAQKQNGMQLVTFNPNLSKTSSDLACIKGMTTAIMARSSVSGGGDHDDSG